MLFGEAKCANLGVSNVSILGRPNVLRPSELPPKCGVRVDVGRPMKSLCIKSTDSNRFNSIIRPNKAWIRGHLKKITIFFRIFSQMVAVQNFTPPTPPPSNSTVSRCFFANIHVLCKHFNDVPVHMTSEPRTLLQLIIARFSHLFGELCND